MKKNILKSKTFYLGLVSALAPLFPSVGAFVSENVGTVSMVWGTLAIALRFITKDKVVLID
jgi:hypothetical protein